MDQEHEVSDGAIVSIVARASKQYRTLAGNRGKVPEWDQRMILGHKACPGPLQSRRGFDAGARRPLDCRGLYYTSSTSHKHSSASF